MNKLLPCPFCGSEVTQVKMSSGKESIYHPMGMNCKLDNINMSLDKSQNRATDPRLVSAIKEIRMKMTGNKDYNAGLVKALLILDEHFEEEL